MSKRCIFCGSIVNQTNNNVYTDFICQNRNKYWHEDIISLDTEKNKTKNKSLKEIIQGDINDIIKKELGTNHLWKKIAAETKQKN